MKVFISWSGARSKIVALALRDWLKDVIQTVEPWCSDKDIKAGDVWEREVLSQLGAEGQSAILCLSSDNLHAPWLHFEAGAFVRALSKSKVVPYLLDVGEADLAPPLSMFQGVKADKDGTLRMLASLNISGPTPILDEAALQKQFDRCWPDLDAKIRQAAGMKTDGKLKPRDQREILEEILTLVRGLDNQINKSQKVRFEDKLREMQQVGPVFSDFMTRMMALGAGVDPSKAVPVLGPDGEVLGWRPTSPPPEGKPKSLLLAKRPPRKRK